MKTFQPGQTVWLETAGDRCEIMELLGSGSRGHVYRVTFSGQEFALKWYNPDGEIERQRAAIDLLIEKGPPSNRFLWPMDTALCQGVAGFGSLMPLKEARFRSMADLMNREVDPDFRTLTHVGVNLADCFLRLHSMGLCCTDFSFGDIFLDPDTGEVVLTGNESLVLDGEGVGGSLGAPRFMAPEIVGGHARACASTDLHSLTVILFHLFMVHHPFEGKREREIPCLDLPAMQRLYGWDALFIFDPKHGANRPVAGVHNNATLFWNLYPDYVRNIFIRAFTDGLRDPAERVKESEWRNVFTQMRDQIYYCHKCEAENFLTNEGDAHTPGADQPCWACGEIPIPPMRLRFATYSIVLNQDTLLYPHHLDENRLNDYSEVMGEMVRHPKKADLWGLKNISQQTWQSFGPSGKGVEVGPGKSVSLVPGLRVRFGNIEATIG